MFRLVPALAALASLACSGGSFETMQSGAGAQASGSSGASSQNGGTNGSGATGGSGASSSGGSASNATPGCADGTREGYLDEDEIAACSGAFSIEGISTALSASPGCERGSGNDGVTRDGQGCSVEDLCSEGFHVCESAQEIAVRSSTGVCPTDLEMGFWLTRQGESVGGECVASGTNNLVGCGNSFGRAAPASCAPLDTEFRYIDCQASSTWECGTAAEANSEGVVVHKSGPGGGGVLCCKD
jgi:hypothetical protein